jgi:hypothetical protein
VLGDVARVQFGAAVDRRTVSLNDDRELHCESGSRAGGGTGSDGWESAPLN